MYRSDASDADKRASKATLYAGMRAEYEAMKRDKWNGYKGYDVWFRDANNASMGAQAAYDDQVGTFMHLFAAEGGDFDRFYAQVKRLAALPKAERDAALVPYRDAPAATARSDPPPNAGPPASAGGAASAGP
jgi:predicted aminopeptidase